MTLRKCQSGQFGTKRGSKGRRPFYPLIHTRAHTITQISRSQLASHGTNKPEAPIRIPVPWHEPQFILLKTVAEVTYEERWIAERGRTLR